MFKNQNNQINIYRYVCEKNPDGAILLIRSLSPWTPKTGAEAYENMIEIMQNCSPATKERLLSGIREIHPDKELFQSSEMEITQPVEITEEKLPACGCGTHFKVTGDESRPTETAAMLPKDYENSLARVVDKLKMEINTNKLLNDKIFKIIVAVIILGIAYKIFFRK